VKGKSADCYMKKVSAEYSETVTAVTSREISGNRGIVRVQTLISKGNIVGELTPEDLFKGHSW
jgi:hypothetical protein